MSSARATDPEGELECARDAQDMLEVLECVQLRINWYEQRRFAAPERTLRARDLIRRMISVMAGANADQLTRDS